MGNSRELTMLRLFPACVDVLMDELKPIHYQDLTRKAIQRLKKEIIFLNDMDIGPLGKNAENVREKLLLSQSRGTVYIGAPYYMGAMRSWFKTNQATFNFDGIPIPYCGDAFESAITEAVNRLPHLRTKSAESPTRNAAAILGFFTEHQVTTWFQRRYPEQFRQAPNKGNYRRGCEYDFSLDIPSYGPLKIDVAGTNKDGEYRKPEGKPTTDFHLLCRRTEQWHVWEGCIRGSGFKGLIFPQKDTFSPIWFLVWINCLIDGIPYTKIGNHLNRTQPYRRSADQ